MMQEKIVEWCLFGSSVCMKSEVWAAWWQGIGSVLAVLIAIWVGHRQVTTARSLDRQKEINKLEAVAAMARTALTLIEEALNATRSKAALELYRKLHPTLAGFDYVESALQRIPLHDVPDAQIIWHVWGLIDAVREARGFIDTQIYAADKELLTHDRDGHLEKVRRYAESSVRSIEEAVREARGEGAR
jgi:hypothetical protein